MRADVPALAPLKWVRAGPCASPRERAMPERALEPELAT